MRTLDNPVIIDQYIQVKAKISELEEQLEAMKPEILNALMDEPKEQASYKGFDFSIQRRKTYEYSPKIKELKDVLKDAQKHERDHGIAQAKTHKAVLVMKANKVEVM